VYRDYSSTVTLLPWLCPLFFSDVIKSSSLFSFFCTDHKSIYIFSSSLVHLFILIKKKTFSFSLSSSLSLYYTRMILRTTSTTLRMCIVCLVTSLSEVLSLSIIRLYMYRNSQRERERYTHRHIENMDPLLKKKLSDFQTCFHILYNINCLFDRMLGCSLSHSLSFSLSPSHTHTYIREWVQSIK
jgi:hypothetical protein